MRICTTCREPIADDAAFCGNCGSRLPDRADVGPPAVGDQADRPSRRWILPALTVLVAVVLVAGIVAVIVRSQQHSSTAAPPNPRTPAGGRGPATTVVTETVTTTPPLTPTPETARQQAHEVELVLLQSIQDRRDIGNAIVDLKSCQRVAAAARTIAGVVADRQQGVADASALNLSLLLNGAMIRARLVEVMQDNLSADSAWIAWSHKRPCVAGRPSPPNAAPLNLLAEDAKDRFLTVWTPVAEGYAIPLPPSPTAVGSF